MGLLAMSPKPFCKHKECFSWIQEAADLSATPFDPYEHFVPVPPCTAIASTNNYVYKSNGFLWNQETTPIGTTPILGPHGLQVSLLLSDNIARYTRYWDDDFFVNKLICLDLCFRKRASPQDGAFVILQLMCDLQLGFHSQDMSRRGIFCRVPSIYMATTLGMCSTSGVSRLLLCLSVFCGSLSTSLSSFLFQRRKRRQILSSQLCRLLLS